MHWMHKTKKKAQTPTQTKAPVAPIKPAKSFEDWQNDVLSRILQVTMNVSI